MRKKEVLFLVAIAVLLCLNNSVTGQSRTLEQLEAKVQKQYEKIYDLIDEGPGSRVFPADPRQRLKSWQDDLADAFAAAEVTIGQILKLQPPNADYWRERRETMALYSTPVSPPETRDVFGPTEVEKRAKLIDAPAPDYPAAALQAKAKGALLLRVVLAADGTVKYIFPMKPLKHGLTEAAMEAARKIKFEPATRHGQAASQFSTLVYEFKNGEARKPFIPEREFAKK